MRGHLSTQILCALLFAALLFCVCPTIKAVQSSAPPAAPTASEKPAPKQSASDSKTPPPPSLQKLAARHKVITNEDLENPHAQKHYRLEKSNEAPSSDPAECDAECAAEAREVAGFGLDRLGEWNVQLIAARHSLATDAEWRRAYFDAFQKTKMYCALQKQQETAVPPSGNDYHSRMERARQEQYFNDMNHTLTTSLQGLSTQISQLIERSQETEPVRAAIMSVLAGRVFSQCASLIDP
jgi:hypothetical protein